MINWQPEGKNQTASFEHEWASAIFDPEKLDADSIDAFVEGGKSSDRLYSMLNSDRWHCSIAKSRAIDFVIFNDITYTLLEFESDRDCDACTDKFDRSQVELVVQTRAHQSCNDHPIVIFKADKKTNRQICLDLFPNCI